MMPERHEIEAAIEASIRKALNRDLGEITPETSMILSSISAGPTR